jgi:hypothetical protein
MYLVYTGGSCLTFAPKRKFLQQNVSSYTAVIYIAHINLYLILPFIAVHYIAHMHLYFVLPMYNFHLYLPHMAVHYIAHNRIWSKNRNPRKTTFSEEVLHALKSKRQTDVSNLLSGHIS